MFDYQKVWEKMRKKENKKKNNFKMYKFFYLIYLYFTFFCIFYGNEHDKIIFFNIFFSLILSRPI